MRHSSNNPQKLSAVDFQNRVKTNPYLGKIYEYDCIIAHPDDSTREQIIKLTKHAPLHVEIGCGSGIYISQLAQQKPHDCFIGFEIRYKRLASIAKKVALHDLHNILLLHEKGEYFADFFETNSLQSLHINFPDPWAKFSQKKHRLLQKPFFETLTRLFKPHARFFFKTDHQEYFASVVELLKEFPQFEVIEYSENLHQSPYVESNIQTEFEKLFLSKHNPHICYLQMIYHGAANDLS